MREFPGDRRTGADNFQPFFIIVNNHRITLLFDQFGLGRRDNESIGISREKSRQCFRRAAMIEKLEVFADFHAAFRCGYSNGNFPEGAGKSRRNRFATQVLKRGNAFLPEQNKRVSVHGGGNVDNIRAR